MASSVANVVGNGNSHMVLRKHGNGYKLLKFNFTESIKI